MEKVTNRQKLEVLKDWLKENNIKYIENHMSKFGFNIDVKIPSLRIAVFLSKGKEMEDAVYNAKNGRMKLKRTYRPFFIRERETKDFIIEKISNCCFDQMVYLQRKFEESHS